MRCIGRACGVQLLWGVLVGCSTIVYCRYKDTLFLDQILFRSSLPSTDVGCIIDFRVNMSSKEETKYNIKSRVKF